MAYTKAFREAGLAVNINSNGSRSVGGNAAMDNTDDSDRRRGGNEGGRWQRGGRYNGRGNNRGRGRGRGYYRGGNKEYTPRSRIEEDDEGDIAMDNERYSRRGRGRSHPYGGSNNSRGGRDRSPTYKSNTSADSDIEWWKVVIPEGAKHSQDWLMKKLQSMSESPFEAVNIHKFKDNFVFFIKTQSEADNLKKVSNRITTKDGSKIFLSVRVSNNPPRGYDGGAKGGSNYQSNYQSKDNISLELETNPEKLDALKNFLGTRYDPVLIKLDLSNIYIDKILRQAGIEGKIYHMKLTNTIFKLINEICPQLKSLDLSSNRINALKILHQLPEMCPALEEINLSDNQLRFTNELSKLKPIKTLTKLQLKSNPLVDQFKGDNTAYYSEVREKVPQLKEIDSFTLPPEIKVDLDVECAIPPSKDNYSVNKDAMELIVKFLQNYIGIYDSSDVNNRQQLLPAYHNDATFSYCNNLSIVNKHGSEFADVKKSRNILRLKDRSVRSQLIKHKKLSVVATLTELPSTKHHFDSFLLDVPVVTPTCLCFIVHGVLLEGADEKPRAFTRSFVAVPESNAQFLIINDELMIRNLTESQLKNISSPPSSQPATQPPAAVSQASEITPDQETLVKKFALESKMNIKWSLDALLSNGWDYTQAALKFADLNGKGQIPSQAFVQ